MKELEHIVNKLNERGLKHFDLNDKGEKIDVDTLMKNFDEGHLDIDVEEIRKRVMK